MREQKCPFSINRTVVVSHHNSSQIVIKQDRPFRTLQDERINMNARNARMAHALQMGISRTLAPQKRTLIENKSLPLLA